MIRYLLIILLAIMGACADKTSNQVTELDWPDLSRFDPSVVEALTAARQRFEGAKEASGQASAKAWGELGKSYQAHHLYPLAEQCYRNALALDPDEALWRYYFAYLLQESGRFEKSAAQYAAFIRQRPDYVPAKLRLAETLYAAGRVEKARAAWQAVADRRPEIAAAFAGLGNIALSQGDYAVAAENFQRALQLQPAATRLYHPLAMALRGSGEIQAAAEALRNTGDRKIYYDDALLSEVSVLSRSAQYYLVPALKAAAAGRHAEAAGLFKKVVEIDPDDASVHAALARVLESLGDMGGSMRETEIALTLNPDLAVALYQKGVLHERRGENGQAIELYTQVLLREPDYAEPRFLLANALMRSGKFDLAVIQYEKLLEKLPANVQVLHSLGLARLASDNCVDAMPPLEKASELSPSFGPVVEALVRTYASCAEAGGEKVEQALADGRWLFDQLKSSAFAEALAMAFAANSLWADAVNLQKQLVSQTNGDASLRAFRRENLQRYLKKQKSVRAWPVGADVFSPATLTARERGDSYPESLNK